MATATAPVKMINLTIEGRTVSVPEGTSILEAARLAGILIPHYCYHPGLPVAGSCRMCLVEVEKMPKLAPNKNLIWRSVILSSPPEAWAQNRASKLWIGQFVIVMIFRGWIWRMGKSYTPYRIL